ncbi:MAG: hypothetical protein ACE5J9_09020 [Methanosarcinales archaeon]
MMEILIILHTPSFIVFLYEKGDLLYEDAINKLMGLKGAIYRSNKKAKGMNLNDSKNPKN